MIRIEGLNKYYHKGKSNELHVINNTTVTLPDNGLVCILGESGSGKTTFMNTVSGLDDFDHGTIEIDGAQIKKFGSKHQEQIRNEKFGYIFQNYYLLMDRTVEYNIMLALSMHKLSEEEKEKRTDYVLKAVGMMKYKKRFVSQLSGGQQQRVGIARALVRSPKVIFADEPTGNLDEANTMNVMGILKKISKKCLVVVVTHEKAIAEFFADRIIKITDGYMEKEIDRESRDIYQYVEDSNLYLQEFSKKELKGGNIELKIYTREETENTVIQIVYENKKLYISAGDSKNVEFLTDNAGKKVIDTKRPVIKIEDAADTAFELEPVSMEKKPKMRFRELMELAVRNRRALGVRQIFLAVTLVIMPILMVICIQEILSAVLIDREALINTDSRYYRVAAQTKRGYDEPGTYAFRTEFGLMTQALFEKGFELCPIPDTELKYNYEGIVQLENYSFEIQNYSFMPLEKMGEENLLYGEMPKDNMEVVFDRLTVEKLLENSGEISDILTDIRQVLGSTVSTKQGIDLTITGISDTGQPDIYISSELMLMLCRENFVFITEDEVLEKFPEYQSRELGMTPDGKVEVLVSRERLANAYVHRLSDIYGEFSLIRKKLIYPSPEPPEVVRQQLREMEEFFGLKAEDYDELLISHTAYLDYTYDGLLTGDIKYQVVGYFDIEEEADFIVPKEAVPYLENAIMDYYQSCYVYSDTEDIKGMEQKIWDAIPEKSREYLQVEVINEAEYVVSNYRQEKLEKLGGRMLVIITVFVISMAILYFIMKTNAEAKIQDLGVYRMFGISKRSIAGMFACESFIITSYTSLPGILITIFIGFVLARIEVLNISMTYPWYAVILTVLFFYAVNILVGIMPVCRLLRLPPAQLAAKYDI